VVRPKSMDHVRGVVGIEVPVHTLVLVEDEFARTVLMAIFGQLEVPLAGIEIVPSQGTAAVLAGVRSLERRRERSAALQSSTATKPSHQCRKPSIHCPEVLAQKKNC